jgi:hypothetical protein
LSSSSITFVFLGNLWPPLGRFHQRCEVYFQDTLIDGSSSLPSLWAWLRQRMFDLDRLNLLLD